MTADREEFVRRQRVLGDFGELALRTESLDDILTEGCRFLAEGLGADFAKIIEVEPNRGTALVRAGVGWRPGVVGSRITLGVRTCEAYSLDRASPVTVEDISADTRFDWPEFMRSHGVVAIVNVPIILPGGQPFGLLQVDACAPRTFGEEDVAYLRTYSMVLGPVIDRLRATRELRRSNERFRIVVENARDHAIFLSDLDDRITDWFPGAVAIFGWTEEEMIGQFAEIVFTPEDRAADVPRRELERARQDGTAPDVRWHMTKSGGRVFLDGQTVALRNDDGSLRGYMKIGQDITERKRAEERRAVLQEELQHRVRNVLAMVAAIVSRGDVRGTAEAFQASLRGRIASMARTQVLLTRGGEEGVDLERLVRDELQAQTADGAPFSVEGPAVLLAPRAAEVLTLAVHELTTNATKHGAFGRAGGHVAVRWHVLRRDHQDWLELEWRETGIHIPADANRRQGFGTELIVNRVPYELAGRGELELRTDGLFCRISFPLRHVDSVLQTDVPSAGLDRTHV